VAGSAARASAFGSDGSQAGLATFVVGIELGDQWSANELASKVANRPKFGERLFSTTNKMAFGRVRESPRWEGNDSLRALPPDDPRERDAAASATVHVADVPGFKHCACAVLDDGCKIHPTARPTGFTSCAGANAFVRINMSARR